MALHYERGHIRSICYISKYVEGLGLVITVARKLEIIAYTFVRYSHWFQRLSQREGPVLVCSSLFKMIPFLHKIEVPEKDY